MLFSKMNEGPTMITEHETAFAEEVTFCKFSNFFRIMKELDAAEWGKSALFHQCSLIKGGQSAL